MEVKADLHWTLTSLADVSLDMGDLTGALEYNRQALTLAETSVAAHPADLYALWRLADCYERLGQYHAAHAAQTKRSLATRIESWREARAWYQKSLNVWDDWPKRAVSSVYNTTRRDRAARALAHCEAALARLGAKPER